MPSVPAPRRRIVAPAVLAACIAAALAPAFIAPGAHAQTAAHAAAVRHYDIPAQPLGAAAREYGRVSGRQVVLRSRIAGDLQSSAVVGEFGADEALQRLLAGTGLVARRMGDDIVALEGGQVAPSPSAGRQDIVATDALSVAGTPSDAGGAVRDQQGYDGVYDLDISTSYIGRAEVERYKGTTPSDLLNGVPGVFSGDARNSGALDVNIRGVQGPGRVPVTIDGTEQALTAWRGYNGVGNRNYIDPNLIGGIQILKGPSLTRDVVTGAGGAVVIKTLDVDDVVPEGERFGGEFKLEGSSNAVAPRLPSRLYTGLDYRDVPELAGSRVADDPTLRVQPHSGGGGYNVFDGEDHAYRLALGWKSERLSLFGAYAYRDRGNYYAGEHDAGYYNQSIEDAQVGDYIVTMASRLRRGDEVTNTSSRMESWLFKATWRPDDDQILQLGFRDTLSHYGEIMPSRINRTALGLPQWPLSRVASKAWNLEYKWQPEGSRWIDFRANAWRTDTDSDAYNAGSYPNYWNAATQPIIVNGALDDANSARNGLALSNRFRLADTLDLTVGGNFQHEKLRSNDEYLGPSASWRMFPRAGRREEWSADLAFEWRPLDFLALNAGARYSSYWAYDDFLAAHPGQFSLRVSGYEATYYTLSDQQRASAEQELRSRYQLCAMFDFYCELLGVPPGQSEADYVAGRIGNYSVANTAAWMPDANGDFHRADNPCTNGLLDSVADLYLAPGRECRVGRTANGISAGYATASKRRDSGWTPSFTATAHFSDYSRAYLSYNEVLRYPSMFESLLSFTASVNPFRPVEPEHIHHYELAYIHDLGHLLAADAVADVKLSYYVRKTRDFIERNNDFMFHNVDKQTVKGVEFQGRYDGGRFFTDLAIAHVLENEVCDESAAIMIDPNADVPTCVDEGFIGSWLLTQAIPELSANWSLGGRFLDRRLELGGRVVYYRKRRENQDLKDFAGSTDQNLGVFNVPFSWGDTWLLDAYASYRLNERLQIDLVGTNLTNRYYADPATRSLLPAPGRTLRLSFTARF